MCNVLDPTTPTEITAKNLYTELGYSLLNIL